jgi:hypothetical protein
MTFNEFCLYTDTLFYIKKVIAINVRISYVCNKKFKVEILILINSRWHQKI